MRVLSKYTRQILAQNAGRDFDRLDIVRFVASIKFAAHDLGVKPAQSRLLVRHFFKAYLHSIGDGKPPLGGVLKELQPAIDRLDLAQWRSKPRRTHRAWETYCKDFDSGAVAALANIKPW
jgi:hypothetical protein